MTTHLDGRRGDRRAVSRSFGLAISRLAVPIWLYSVAKPDDSNSVIVRTCVAASNAYLALPGAMRSLVGRSRENVLERDGQAAAFEPHVAEQRRRLAPCLAPVAARWRVGDNGAKPGRGRCASFVLGSWGVDFQLGVEEGRSAGTPPST
jgi:hypothetical protein